MKCSLGLVPVNGEIVLYKRVNKINEGVYFSCYDKEFIYKDGEIVEVEKYEENPLVSCGAGLHVSTYNYWDKGDTVIACLIKEEDIITCQRGKLRVKN